MDKEIKELIQRKLDIANHHIGYINDYYANVALRELFDVVELLATDKILEGVEESE